MLRNDESESSFVDMNWYSQH